MDNKNVWRVGGNPCNCHPETCCCNDYAVYRGSEKKYTFFSRAQAEEVVEAMNEVEEMKMRTNP